MKFSIAWIFEHLAADWHAFPINELVAQFNQKTAEIERIEPISYDLMTFSMAQLMAADSQKCMLFSPEWRKEITLNPREGATIGDWFLLKKEAVDIRWAFLSDLGSGKDGMVPNLYCPEHLQDGSWKKEILTKDCIIEVDNKSITHRPDLWGHRGIARECGAILGVPLKPFEQFLDTLPITRGPKTIAADILSLSVHNAGCKSLAALNATIAENRPSSITMAFTLAKVDVRPINALVDLTNYVMFDIGAPMHVFDAQAVGTNTLSVRLAKTGEKLALLDGETVTLADYDLVITDGKNPISLAGIMGGKATSAQLATKRILIEAGCFDASMIRLASARLKKRSESSARFEKSLDANEPEYAVRRFLKLAHVQQLGITPASHILFVGEQGQTKSIEVSHHFIESRLGVTLEQKQVINILEHLEFGVAIEKRADDVLYKITVPPFRATKDVLIKEDIVEEVGRCYGYDRIPRALPVQHLKPWDMTPVMRTRMVKQFLAYGVQMQEVYNYALFDEQFLQQLDWAPRDAARVQSPISEHWQRLVTSLIPHLIKNVQVNAEHHDHVRFFEWGRTWSVTNDKIAEKRVLAGIMVHQKGVIDFYTAKQDIERFCSMLALPISWTNMATPEDPWYAPHESAYLIHEGTQVGRAGKIDQSFLHRVVLGDGFIFEFDADFLVNYVQSLRKYEPTSKYPEVIRDISCWVPVAVMVDQIIALVKTGSPLLRDVHILDYFTSEEDKNRKALTIRLVIQDFTKTLTKEEVDSIMHSITQSLEKIGAVIR